MNKLLVWSITLSVLIAVSSIYLFTVLNHGTVPALDRHRDT